MRRLLLLPTLVLGALALVPAIASAKEITSAKVCGADGCQTITGAARLQGWADGGPPTSAPGRAAAFYTIRLTIKAEQGRRDNFTVTYLPGVHLLRGSDGTWMSVPAEQAAIFAPVTNRLTPFPKERLHGLRSAGPPSAQVGQNPSPADAPVAPDGGSFPWIATGMALAGCALLAGVAWALRRRPHGRPRPQPEQ